LNPYWMFAGGYPTDSPTRVKFRIKFGYGFRAFIIMAI
jgi:hypothetical protein